MSAFAFGSGVMAAARSRLIGCRTFSRLGILYRSSHCREISDGAGDKALECLKAAARELGQPIPTSGRVTDTLLAYGGSPQTDPYKYYFLLFFLFKYSMNFIHGWIRAMKLIMRIKSIVTDYFLRCIFFCLLIQSNTRTT